MPFTREELLDAAAHATGLSDFGAPNFEPGLAALLESYRKEARLNDLGRRLVRDELVGDLIGRLQVVDQLKRQPEIRDTELVAPIFIVGLPRTGTTTLQQMFQQDPDSQVLEYWLGVAPQPRPPRESWERHPRYREVAEVLRLTYEADPSLRALHDISADSAGECRFVLRHLFMDDSYDHNVTAPSYRAWFDAQSMEPVYHWYRDVLKLIQFPQAGRRWVLKYPPHFRFLKALFSVFPNARIIQTHRDPAKVLPSHASLLTRFASVYEDDVDPRAKGQLVWELISRQLEQGTRDRDALGRPDQFFDLHFRDVMADPVGSIERALQAFGLPLSDAGREAMSAWHRAHPPERHGKHEYEPEAFGLHPGAISERFLDYRERFGVPEE